MRITVIVSDFPKVTETFALRNVLHYLQAGHEVEIFHLKPFRRGEVVHAFARPAVDAGFTFGWFDRSSTLALVGALGRLWRLLTTLGLLIAAFWRQPSRLAASLAIVPKSLALARHVAGRSDHIHAEFAGYPATAAWIAARFSGVPFSFSSHAHDIFLTQGLLARKARDAAFVRTISAFNRRFLSDVPGFPSDKIHVVRCGIETDRYHGPPVWAEGPLRVLFVGSLMPRKGVHHLIDALPGLDGIDWTCRILGDGPERAALEARAGGDPRFRFEGAAPAEQVAQAFDWAHLVVVPSTEGAGGRSEGIPVVLMEAMAHGRPVIASHLSGIPELVRDGDTGLLVPPGDIPALTQAIATVAGDYRAALARAERARALVSAEYDIRKNAGDLLKLIEGAS